MPSRLSLTGTADLPDTVSQFINQRRFLARNSSSDASATGTPQTSGKGLDSSSAAPFSASIELDNARVYFPGQLFKVKIHVAPKNDASQVEEIAVEIKAWTHSYGWASNGSSSYPVFEKFVHYSVELPPGPQDGNSATNAGTGLDISKSDEQPNTWLISTRLPSTVINKTGWRSTGETTSIPPTFKDVKSSLSNTVYWIIKLTAKRSGVFKRNFRIWKPFIVLPLSPRAPPASNLPMLVISPEGLPPTPQSIRSALPDSWSTFSLESKLKSAKLPSALISSYPRPNTSDRAPFPSSSTYPSAPRRNPICSLQAQSDSPICPSADHLPMIVSSTLFSRQSKARMRISRRAKERGRKMHIKNFNPPSRSSGTRAAAVTARITPHGIESQLLSNGTRPTSSPQTPQPGKLSIMATHGPTPCPRSGLD
ncbi:unnamed protein product [Tilletia caries]|nr:unnamed protein product [Tilletia caries]